MKTSTILSAAALFVAQSYAACTQIPAERGNAMTVVEECPYTRDVRAFACPQNGATIQNPGRQSITTITAPEDVTLKIIGFTETGGWYERPAYFTCTAGTVNQDVILPDGPFGTFAASVVA